MNPYREPPPPCKECKSLRERNQELKEILHKYQHPGFFRNFFFDEYTNYKQLSGAGFVVSLLTALVLLFSSAFGIAKTIDAVVDADEQRDCRGACTAIGGTRAHFYEEKGFCLCRTPNTTKGYSIIDREIR